MKYDFAYPCERLKPFVKNFWGIENKFLGESYYTHRIIPSALPELILYIDHKPSSDKRSLESRLLLNGQQNSFYDLLINDDLCVFSILFEPQGVSQFFDMPFNELTNLSIPLSYLNKNLATEIEIKLSDCETFAQRTTAVEDILETQLYKHHNYSDFARIDHIIETIKQSQGNIRIETLADEANLSRKQFERIFLRQIGASPRQYLNIVRFQSAIFNKSQHHNISLTQLAHASGYYDQSHFISDFKRFTGITPRTFFSEDCEPISDLFQ